MFTRHINGRKVEIDLISKGGWHTFRAPAYDIEITGQDKGKVYADLERVLGRTIR